MALDSPVEGFIYVASTCFRMDTPPLGIAPAPMDKKPSGGGGLFGTKKKEEPGLTQAGVADVISEVNNANRRLRVLEDRYANIRDKMQFLEQNQIGGQKNLMTELRATQHDLLEAKRLFKELNERVMLLGQELANNAKKEDVLVLKRYIELWQPLNFVTRNQVEKMIAELLDEKLQRGPQENPQK